jgi:hypothetical protein
VAGLQGGGGMAGFNMSKAAKLACRACLLASPSTVRLVEGVFHCDLQVRNVVVTL